MDIKEIETSYYILKYLLSNMETLYALHVFSFVKTNYYNFQRTNILVQGFKLKTSKKIELHL